MRYKEIINRHGNRWYEDILTGKSVPSVTTITSIRSPFKGKPGDYAVQGSLCHYHLEKHFTSSLDRSPPNIPTGHIWSIPSEDVNDNIYYALKMYVDLRDEVKLDKIIGVEDVVLNEEHGYAGKPDRWGILDNKIILDEYKTGNFYDYYWMQGAAYAKMINADQVRFIMLDVNKKRNPDRKGKILYMNRNDIDVHFKDFLYCLDEYHKQNA